MLDSNVIRDPRLLAGGEVVERDFPTVGHVRFENFAPGQWMTKAGNPAKIARRRYLFTPLDGEQTEVESVSWFADSLRKRQLEIWIETQATIGAVKAERLGELDGVPEEDWKERVRSLGLGASARKEQGADRGEIIHDAMHKLAVEGVAPNPADVPGIARPWVQAAMRAWLTLGVDETLEAECIVVHPELMYAGRFDLLCRTGKLTTLVDHKTGKGKIYTAAHWQSRLYAMAIEKCLRVQVDRIKLLGVGDDGSFEIVNCAVSEEEARALVAVARADKRADKSMRQERRAA